MANFESGLGNKKNGGQNSTRQFVVEDVQGEQNAPFDLNAIRSFQNQMNESDAPEEDIQQIERDMQRSRQEKRTGRQRLDPGAKKRLEQLLGIVRTEKEVVLNEKMTFVLQTLKSGELNDVLAAARKEPNQFDFDWQLRRHNLSRSIKTIAGIKFTDFVGSEDIEDLLYFIDQLDDFVLTKLYKEYGNLSKEAQDKYGVNTDEKQKEVVEDLKK